MEEPKRPSLKENEEDLFKEQELLLKNKDRFSVPLKNIKKSDITQNKKTSGDLDSTTSKMPEEEELVVHQDEVIFEVQERLVSEEPFVFKLPSISPNGVANLLEEKLVSSKFSKKRKEQRLQTSTPSIKKERTEEKGSENLIAASSLLTTSLLVDGSGLENGSEEAENIHQENQAKISAMTEQEILKCQKQLKNSLDPNVIEFIRSKRSGTKIISEMKKDISKKTHYVQNTSKQIPDQDVGEILRKEGRNDCDALLLEKSFKQTEFDEKLRTNFKNKPKVIGVPKEVKELMKESNKGKWQNMDKVETEKLEWLSDLPKPNPIDLKTGFTARFDFEGKLLAPDVDVPIHEGLHHHGEEPEVAGYSLEELFLLARSSLQSQRITALHTIAHILDNYWCGMMDHCFESPLLNIVLQAGIVPLLRWALDDTSITSVSATVTAIHSLLISKADEASLHKTFYWLNGHLLPQVEVIDLDEHNVTMEELTDADLIKLDVIKGFLRIDILPRFMYILQVMQPPPLVCKLVIEICGHLAQHSNVSAFQVSKHSGLLLLIFEKFLPLAWKYVDGSKLTDTVNYCQPLSSAMKLLRIIISSSRELALFVMENFDLMNVLTLYLTIHPMDEKLSLPDMQSLMVETLKTLHMLLSYGFGFEIFLDLNSILLPQTEFCLSLSMNMEEIKHYRDFEYASHLFKTFEALVMVAHANKNSDLKAFLLTIFKQAVLCLKKWFYQLKQEKTSDSAMSLFAAALNFVSTYYQKAHGGLTCNDWKPCSIIKDLYTNYLIPFIKSENFKVLLEKIKTCSLLLSEGLSGYKRDSKTMASLGSIEWQGDVVPLLQEGTPVPLLLAIFNFISIHKSLFNDGEIQAMEELLSNSTLIKYLNKVCVSKLNTGSWFVRYETLLISLLLKLSLFSAQKNLLQWHRIALTILPILKMPDECLIEDIFEDIIFSDKYLPISDEKNDQDIILNLPVIAQCYSSYFLHKTQVSKSRFLLHGDLELESISCPGNPKQLLPKDWCYAPIFDLYHEALKKQSSSQLASEDILLVMSTLQWILLCHHLSLSLLQNISASLQYCYLSMVFLLDFDSFQLPKLSALLEANFLALTKEKHFDFSKVKSDNINSFEDLYHGLLNHFTSWSCGDHLFGNCILIPLQQSFANHWRKLLLTDYSEALYFLGVPLTKLLVPLQNYLYPYETDSEILKKYLELLFKGLLTNKRCPLLYLMAVHHIHHYIFLKSEEYLKCQKFLVLSITKTKNTILKDKLLLYSEVNAESEFGFNLKEELTEDEKQHIKNILK